MIVGHVVNYFDPSCDVTRCVRELNKYSRYKHVLYVKEPHPELATYQFEDPDPVGWNLSQAEIDELLKDADILLFHFAGVERGWGFQDHEQCGRPMAFRNIHIAWDGEKFWTNQEYTLARSYDRYILTGAAHVGAAEFLPDGKFRWLPDLLPLDGPYSFDPSPRPPAVSYIKHAEELDARGFGGARRLNCSQMAHADVLAVRSASATVVIDNVSDGHYGLAGQEAAIMGLPVVGYNHLRTLEAMQSWVKPGTIFPFWQAETLDDAVLVATHLAQESGEFRYKIRAWAEEFLNPRRLIAEYWDKFFDEMPT